MVDVIVIGAGAGGGVAACVLAEAGKSVLLLERGRSLTFADIPRDHLRNIGLPNMATEQAPNSKATLEFSTVSDAIPSKVATTTMPVVWVGARWCTACKPGDSTRSISRWRAPTGFPKEVRWPTGLFPMKIWNRITNVRSGRLASPEGRRRRKCRIGRNTRCRLCPRQLRRSDWRRAARSLVGTRKRRRC